MQAHTLSAPVYRNVLDGRTIAGWLGAIWTIKDTVIVMTSRHNYRTVDLNGTRYVTPGPVMPVQFKDIVVKSAYGESGEN